ncbi:hypothetical protein K160097B7_12310 [[Clostridium] hylemonae]|uniref:GDSL-type esterase/lipase family protein n=6 Tax=[Clostridium] hylemonae TaxID=89153 RepID=UPI0036F2335D
MSVTSRKIFGFLFSLIMVLNVLMTPLSVSASEGTVTARIDGIPDGIIYEGDNIQLKVFISDTLKEYEYQFVEEYEGKENIVRDYDTDNYFIPELNAAGTYNFFVNIREKGMEFPLTTEKCTFNVSMKQEISDGSANNGVDKKTGVNNSTFAENNKSENNSTQDKVNIVKDALKAELYSNKSTKEYIARDIILNAAHTGGYGTIKYRFRESYNGKTTVVQDYSESAEYRFRTRGEGIHVYYVDAQDEEGQTATQSYTMSVVMYPGSRLGVSLQSNKSTKEYTARDIILNAAHTGGYGTIKYRFRESYNGKTTVVQDYSESAEYRFRTRGEGIHVYYVDAQDEEGQTATQSYTMSVVMYPGSRLGVSLQSNKSTKEYTARDIILNAAHTGGYGTIKYRFRESYNGKTTVVQDYSESAEYRFRTRGEGIHVYYVDAQDEEGQTATQSYTMSVVMYPGSRLGVSLQSNKSTKEYTARDIILNAAHTGGYGTIKYRFRESYNGKTTVVQDYSESAEYRFRTRGEGIHVYYVDAQDEEGQTATQSYTMSVVMYPGSRLGVSLQSNKSTKEYTARDIILNAAHTGGYGTIKYRFRESYNGKTTVVQDYSESAEYRFRTRGEGIHVYYVDAQDEEGQTATQSYTMSVVMYPGSRLGVSLQSNKSTNEYIARDIILNAAHTGGYGTIKYRFRESYNGKTTVVQDYSESAEYRFRTSGQGTHIYYVDAQDEEGQFVTQSYTMRVVVHPLMKLTGNVLVDGGTTVYENRKVTISSQIAGGYGKCKYEFSEVYSGKRTVVQKSSINNSYTFNTHGKGLHTFYVDVVDEEQQKIQLVQSIEIREYPTIISFFGDSLTNRGDWQTWFPSYIVVNSGIGSNTTKQMRDRIDDVLSVKPNKVFILGGINDFGRGISKAETLSNLESIVEQIQFSLPNTQIYVQSILPTGGAVDNNEIKALNQLIKNMCIQKGVVYIELFDSFCNNGSIDSSLYYMDGVHLQDKGYQKWINILKGYL